MDWRGKTVEIISFEISMNVLIQKAEKRKQLAANGTVPKSKDDRVIVETLPRHRKLCLDVDYNSEFEGDGEMTLVRSDGKQ